MRYCDVAIPCDDWYARTAPVIAGTSPPGAAEVVDGTDEGEVGGVVGDVVDGVDVDDEGGALGFELHPPSATTAAAPTTIPTSALRICRPCPYRPPLAEPPACLLFSEGALL
jgi:hypothetical protein